MTEAEKYSCRYFTQMDDGCPNFDGSFYNTDICPLDGERCVDGLGSENLEEITLFPTRITGTYPHLERLKALNWVKSSMGVESLTQFSQDLLSKPILTGKLKGIRTCAWTGKVTEVELEFEITFWEYQDAKSDDLVFQVTSGGVTGYESFIIHEADNVLEKMKIHGWCACMGTDKKYDKLEVSAEEMQKVKLA
jgi:hypothetical protein